MIFVHLFNNNFGDNHVFSLFLLIKNNEERKRKRENKNNM